MTNKVCWINNLKSVYKQSEIQIKIADLVLSLILALKSLVYQGLKEEERVIICLMKNTNKRFFNCIYDHVKPCF